jgi:S1-C subfamily serine protease
MQGWLAPLVGTTLGLALTAFGAALVVPEKPVFDIRPAIQRWLQPPAPASVPREAVVPPPAPVAEPARVPAPQVARLPPPPGLPSVPQAEPAPLLGGGIEGLLRRPPSGWSTGTGFFVSGRGTVLTAAHVVRGCGSVKVLSAHIRPEMARVVAADAEHDVAVLEVPGMTAPAWLALGLPGRGVERLAVFGFPQGSLPDTPNESWAGYANEGFAPRSGLQVDPGQVVWFRSGEVGPGFSGGPVVDLGSGRVVGMVRGGIDSQRVPLLAGVATAGLALGPGAGPMQAMLSRHTVREGVVPAGLSVGSALEMVRRATVRVVCSG